MSALEHIHDSLVAIGAPPISHEELERLYQGRMAEVLDFVAANVVGRKKAAAARHSIQSQRVEQIRADQHVDPLYARVQRAEARLRNARVALEASEQAHRAQLQNVARHEREEAALQAGLDNQQKTVLILSILERKEEVRRQRFQEISRLLHELRDKAHEAYKAFEQGQVLPDAEIDTTGKPVRTEHTRDTLAALQAHGLTLSRLSALAKEAGLAARTQEAESRIRDAVARIAAAGPDDLEVDALYDRYLAGAKSRARASVQYRSPLPTSDQQIEISEVVKRIAEKEEQMQQAGDRSAALILACARAVKVTSEFSQGAAPQLNSELQTEATQSRGYVDALRLSVISRDGPSDKKPESQGMSLSHGRSFERTLTDIEHAFSDARDTEAFLEAAGLLLTPDHEAVQHHAAIADMYAKEEDGLSGRLCKLLERKGKKADAGHVLIQDIERLIAEVGIITGTHL
ncbi:hypothetical protein BD413DRAFT_41896 [Trametes elegans]|nr:hypothetical protein BD413DRAFT_41896 [Trametes elegans]